MNDSYLAQSIINKKRGPLLTNYIGQDSTEEKPINSYREKFRNTYCEIKTSLYNIKANTKNYTNEISRLEYFLGIINQHETNYNIIIQRFNNLKNKLEETIQMENIIKTLSSNQYISNI